ncbi:aminoglycoside 3-N-acetyltransferase [Spirosoma sp. SC4-14]|uniref:aminoglycoside 3-N-acetyltransferase n=1 Tax=Spirosoma sp. SC4-14 TaxID=3128900 RepID=UPI0030D50B52
MTNQPMTNFMLTVGDNLYWTRRLLGEHLRRLGLRAGDAVMVHAGLRAVGPMLNGPDTLIDAIRDVIGNQGTLLCYVNWEQQYEDALNELGQIPAVLKPDIAPFNTFSSRASRDHGVFAEFVRTTPGALRSQNPGASVAAIGRLAKWFTTDHPFDYGYGPGSPFEKLVLTDGKILMIGAPLDTMSILHHAEHLAQIPGKRIRHMEVPLQLDGEVCWRMIEEFDTADPVVDGLDADYFKTIVEDFLNTESGLIGRVGGASAVIVSAKAIVQFAVRWLEQRFG